jgi:hypothetical protein
MKSRQLIDRIFEADEAAVAPKGGDQATVKIEISGSPKLVQKAIKQLAKEKPAGVKVKAGGETVTADSDDVKVGGDKGKDKGPKKPEPKDKEPKKDAPADKDKAPKKDDKFGDGDDE